MTTERDVSKSPPSQLTNNDTSVTTHLKSPSKLTCQVCGDKARIFNYSALSCQSCKTFFRRNGFHPESVRPCVFNRSCEINMLTRHTCAACRLAKCLKMGMSPHLIRKEDRKIPKHSAVAKSNNVEQVIPKQITTLPMPTTLDLLQGDRSLLIDSEWTLLSNIVHAHDIFSCDSQVRHTIDSLSTSSVDIHFNMINPLEIVRQIFISVRSFISSSPDFRILTLNEQNSLVERNLQSAMGFNLIFAFRNTGILHSAKCMEAFTVVYGSDIMLKVKDVTERLDPDSTLIKLILIIFAFSSNCLLLNIDNRMEDDNLLCGTFRLLGSQNVYVELLRKYMIYRYGYNESSLRFAGLIQIFLCTLENAAIIHKENEAHRKMIDNAIEETKQFLTINVNQHLPLWGKT